jgi:hypothetical protein
MNVRAAVLACLTASPRRGSPRNMPHPSQLWKPVPAQTRTTPSCTLRSRKAPREPEAAQLP